MFLFSQVCFVCVCVFSWDIFCLWCGSLLLSSRYPMGLFLLLFFYYSLVFLSGWVHCLSLVLFFWCYICEVLFFPLSSFWWCWFFLPCVVCFVVFVYSFLWVLLVVLLDVVAMGVDDFVLGL